MAWEWHERRRKNGKFVPDWQHTLKGAPFDQIHIRMHRQEAIDTREAAAGNRMELGEYCRRAIMERVKQDQKRRSEWVPIPLNKIIPPE